jgi:hypothetical protein
MHREEQEVALIMLAGMLVWIIKMLESHIKPGPKADSLSATSHCIYLIYKDKYYFAAVVPQFSPQIVFAIARFYRAGKDPLSLRPIY